MDERTATRDRILQAAMARIKHYGYGKTTMAEIASDCEMSPGNIYRFFESKIDIAEAMARQHYMEQNAALSAIARRKDIPVEKRLRLFFLERARQNYTALHQDVKILEVADVLARERPLFIEELLASEMVILKAMVEEGMQSGLFAPGEAEFTAEMLQIATARFLAPRLLYHSGLQELERSLNGVLDLVFYGLFARPAPQT